MDEFVRGVRIFQTRIFPKRRLLFERLARGQAPSALFITCADSRIIPSLITHTPPGELFVERNPGNIVPIYGAEAAGESASIEYAVAALQVRHVVVCGHSDCGAVKALLNPEKVRHLPAVARWLRGIEPAQRLLESEPQQRSDEQRVRRLTELNVRIQVENLRTHPSVAMRLERGDITLHGWVYQIEAGEIRAMNATGDFLLWPGDDEKA